MFERENTLSARLGGEPIAPRAAFTPALKGAIEAATGGHLAIRGAGNSHTTVEVSGLVQGTTKEDVAAIFKRCGDIVSSKAVSTAREVRIRVTFKDTKSAQNAVNTFDKQQADGKTLSVHIVGINAPPTLAGRIADKNGLSTVELEGSVDILMAGSADSGSYVAFLTGWPWALTRSSRKMRSDAMIKDPRAQVLVAPPGTDPAEYTQSRGGRGRGRGGRRGQGGRGRRGGGRKMDID